MNSRNNIFIFTLFICSLSSCWLTSANSKNILKRARSNGYLQFINKNKNVMFQNLNNKIIEVFSVSQLMVSEGKCENAKDYTDNRMIKDLLLPETRFQETLYSPKDNLTTTLYGFLPGKERKHFIIVKLINPEQNATVYVNKKSSNLRDDLTKCLNVTAPGVSVDRISIESLARMLERPQI